MNYTKGEWRILAPETGHEERVKVVSNVDENGYFPLVCHVYGVGDRLANANLIAAAPDMYEALKKIELFLQDPDVKVMAKGLPNQIGLEITFEKCQQALTKAEGKEEK
ncbi:unnamed protein product [marine sediment metagenome]|uniref:Uncharacterized protein n=1 Tax=marine sediment metagenome TaxID=412755 RepID=X1IDN7_9ZZZZ